MRHSHHWMNPEPCEVPDEPLTTADWLRVAGLAAFLAAFWVFLLALVAVLVVVLS